MARIRLTEREVGPGEVRSRFLRGSFVYRIYGKNGDLLYVGKTSYPLFRLKAHRRQKAWWSMVGVIELEDFPKDYMALDAERTAIKEEGPVHNIRSARRCA